MNQSIWDTANIRLLLVSFFYCLPSIVDHTIWTSQICLPLPTIRGLQMGKQIAEILTYVLRSHYTRITLLLLVSNHHKLFYFAFISNKTSTQSHIEQSQRILEVSISVQHYETTQKISTLVIIPRFYLRRKACVLLNGSTQRSLCLA